MEAKNLDVLVFCEVCFEHKRVTKYAVQMCIDHDVKKWYCGHCEQDNPYTDELLKELGVDTSESN